MGGAAGWQLLIVLRFVLKLSAVAFARELAVTLAFLPVARTPCEAYSLLLTDLGWKEEKTIIYPNDEGG